MRTTGYGVTMPSQPVNEPQLRLERIAEAHIKSIDSHGGTLGDCTECGWAWPCPTYHWATDEIVDELGCWNPDDNAREPEDM